jgi:hypothetical protein
MNTLPTKMNTFAPTFRYTFDKDTIALLQEFANSHTELSSKEYRRAWSIWIEEQSEPIEREIRRLQHIGCEEDIYKKMYRSVRYYYTKKEERSGNSGEARQSQESQEPQQPQETPSSHQEDNVASNRKRTYVSISKNFMGIIRDQIETQCIGKLLKPSDGFEAFFKLCNETTDDDLITLVNDEISSMVRKVHGAVPLDADNDTIQKFRDEFFQRIKKVYKNKYFQMVKT